MTRKIVTGLVSLLLTLGLAWVMSGQVGAAPPPTTMKPTPKLCRACVVSNSVTITLILQNEWAKKNYGKIVTPGLVTVVKQNPANGTFGDNTTPVGSTAKVVNGSFVPRDEKTYQVKYTVQQLPANQQLEVRVAVPYEWSFYGNNKFTITPIKAGGRTLPGHASVTLTQQHRRLN